MEQKDSMAGPSAWFCFILSFDSIENSCIFRQFVLTCMSAVSAETGRIYSLWFIFEKISTCAVGCSFEHPTHFPIRKTRACALLRLHSQPRFAHLEVDCNRTGGKIYNIDKSSQ